MSKLEFIVLIYCATVCYGFRHKITFYTEGNCTGEGLILESKQSDLVPEAPRIVSTYKSILAIGYWRVYAGVDFQNGGWRFPTPTDSPLCFNSSSGRKSARYLGPPDTTTSSLSLYRDTYSYGGIEVTITGPAFANLPFLPNAIFITGATRWTFYTGNNFDGNATCYIPQSDRWYDDFNGRVIVPTRSILRGCERHIDHFIYGGNEKEGIMSPNVKAKDFSVINLNGDDRDN